MRSIRLLCSIKECDSLRHAKGYCAKHYYKYKTYGDALFDSGYHPHSNIGMPAYFYVAWNNIKRRTGNPNHPMYKRYGGRGIVVCEGWRKSLYKFCDDLGERPSPQYSIDRIDPDGNYSCGTCEDCSLNDWPSNCRWADARIQAWNQSTRHKNTSGYIGVIKNNKGWGAQLSNTIDGKRGNLWFGTYRTKEEAAIEYDKAAIFFRGEYAVTNFL